MKQALIGILTISCVLSVPSWNRFSNFQETQFGIGETAEAAPRFRIPPWARQVIKGVGKKALDQGVSTTINNLGNKPAANRGSSSTIGFVGNLCKSDQGRFYIVTTNGSWMYHDSSRWTGISKPAHTVACYIDLATDASGKLYWRRSQPVFGYVPRVGWVIP